MESLHLLHPITLNTCLVVYKWFGLTDPDDIHPFTSPMLPGIVQFIFSFLFLDSSLSGSSRIADMGKQTTLYSLVFVCIYIYVLCAV